MGAAVIERTYGVGDFRFELVEEWAQLPEGWSLETTGIAIGPSDNVYTYNRTDHPVIVFDRNGEVQNSWGKDRFVRPHEITVEPDGAIWLDDEAAHTVTKYDPQGNELLVLGTGEPSDSGYTWYGERKFFESLDTIARGAPPFNRPCGVSIASTGDIYVSDGYGNARMHKFSPKGELIKSWGEPGTGPGEFRCAHGVTVDEARGRLIVCDRENHRLQLFDLDGTYITEWNDIHRPTKTALDADGNIYISVLAWRPNTPETPNTMAGVKILSPDGELLASWGPHDDELHDLENALFLAPHTIAVDSRGDLYVGEVREAKLRGTKVIRKFARV